MILRTSGTEIMYEFAAGVLMHLLYLENEIGLHTTSAFESSDNDDDGGIVVQNSKLFYSPPFDKILQHLQNLLDYYNFWYSHILVKKSVHFLWKNLKNYNKSFEAEWKRHFFYWLSFLFIRLLQIWLS